MKYAIVFPGQGSQSLEMLNAWGEHHAVVDGLCNEASEVLGYDLADIIANGPEEKLNQTAITQPAMLLADVIAWSVWKLQCEEHSLGLPSVLAGHSLGEYSALVAAEAISFADAIQLVEYRGLCMQEAVSEGAGAMAAIIGLEDDKVIEGCELASSEGIVEAVNFNAPGQVVIAGEKEAVEAAQIILKDAGARRALPLPVSVPSHCKLMIPAAERLATRLEDIKITKPAIAVLHNVDVQSHQDVSEIRKLLVEQLHKPVRWVETMRSIAETGVNKIVECGPGKVLCGLQRRIDKSIVAKPVFDQASLADALELFQMEL